MAQRSTGANGDPANAMFDQQTIGSAFSSLHIDDHEVFDLDASLADSVVPSRPHIWIQIA